MSDKSIVDAIRHYQKDIERCPDNKDRMLRCIKRLYVLPINIQHLKDTGVGMSVNNLRKYGGEVGDAATALVAKWKAMVAAQDSDCQEDSASEIEEEEEMVETSGKFNGDSSPKLDETKHSVRDKENIRHNHHTDKPKTDRHSKSNHKSVEKHSEKKSSKDDSGRVEKSSKDDTRRDEKSSKDDSRRDEKSSRDDSRRNEKSSKDDSRRDEKSSKDDTRRDEKSSKHSSSRTEKENKDSSKKESSSKSHKKDRSSDRHKSDRSESKSSSNKDKPKQKEDKDKEHTKEKDKRASKHHSESGKESSKEHRHSSSKEHSSKDKLDHSKNKESSKRESYHDVPKIKKEKHSSEEREKERKGEKRKHESKDRNRNEVKKAKVVKKEVISSDEEENSSEEDSEEQQISERNSSADNDSDSSVDQRSDEQRSDEQRSEESDESEDDDQESYRNVRIKQEPQSESETESRKSSHSNDHRSSSSHKDRRSSSSHSSKHEMKPPSSTSKSSNLKALIKENERKIKKEKHDDDKSSSSKKSKVKIEMNQDGSIDSGSGASFADALMGFDQVGSSKKKKKKEQPESPRKSASSSQGSRSPSQCSTTSSISTAASSPSKSDRKSTKNLMKEPDLLAKRPVKLEPLNLDISSTLPEISTNYKPLPSVPQTRHTPQFLTEEDMFTIMTSKSQRTKVYSGAKYGVFATVPSLYSICIQLLYDNIEGLEYTGGVPFDILKPLLIKLNSEQLLTLEHFNPYLIADTDELWKFHCSKNFPKAQKDDMETWRETYLRHFDEREMKLKRLTANITESMAKSIPVRQAKLAYVDTIAKPPRSIARKQAKYGTGGSSSSTVTSTSSPGASGSGSSANLAAAAANQAKKKEIVSKAVVGAFTPATPATESVSGFSNPAAAAKILKKKKAPLMAKALQLIKSNHRYKR